MPNAIIIFEGWVNLNLNNKVLQQTPIKCFYILGTAASDQKNSAKGVVSKKNIFNSSHLLNLFLEEIVKIIDSAATFLQNFYIFELDLDNICLFWLLGGLTSILLRIYLSYVLAQYI